jgi:hypothetical protein
MKKTKSASTHPREDRNVSLAPLDFDEAVTDLLSVPAPPKAKPKKRAKKKAVTAKRTRRST